MSLLTIALLAPPIFEFIFKQICARVILLHFIAFFAWIHWVARPVFFRICRTSSSLTSKFPFSVSQILLISATTKNKTIIKNMLYLLRILCCFGKEGSISKGLSKAYQKPIQRFCRKELVSIYQQKAFLK